MAKKRAEKRGKNRDNNRRSKKKVSLLTQEKVDYVDYKDVNLLRRFVSERAKIRARRVTGNDAQQQREIARAIKNAREMALIPYANRVTTQRGRKSDRGDRGDRGERGDRGDRGDREPRESREPRDEQVREPVEAVDSFEAGQPGAADEEVTA